MRHPSSSSTSAYNEPRWKFNPAIAEEPDEEQRPTMKNPQTLYYPTKKGLFSIKMFVCGGVILGQINSKQCSLIIPIIIPITHHAKKFHGTYSRVKKEARDRFLPTKLHPLWTGWLFYHLSHNKEMV
ncbi:uncharacterized protein [Pyxicephalus adspersus]|uniref:uncharacterized protein isoform X2 n=1 Tax=Pyxicephalus adspersus TaxID=30357 RepID=UPI003B595120